jgi:hypothetical protein
MLETVHHPGVHAALARLRSLHDGDMGVVETIACGDAAIPELKEILFSREPSGIYETRRHAVEALAGLRALDVLREFLAGHRDIRDPVEQTGEDAVMNAAARALGRMPDTRDLPLLIQLAREHPLAGVIETLGTFRRLDALPYFIRALGDDFLRPSAERAIMHLGRKAVRPLAEAALDRGPMFERESSSSIVRRRSVLRLLGALPTRREDLPAAFFQLVDEKDGWIGFLAIDLCLPHLSKQQSLHAVRASIRYLKSADDLLAHEIEDLLVAHYPLVAADIAELQKQHHETEPVWRVTDRTYSTLERVQKRTCKPDSGAAHD